MVNTKSCIALAKMAEQAGADGISVLQPMFLKPTEDELYAHFKAIANAVPNLPMLLYNNPGRVGYTMSGNLVERLAREVDNIVGIKDSSGDMTQTEEFIRRTQDIDFKVFGGKDTLIYATLAHGGVGAVCTTANYIPDLVVSVYNAYLKGNPRQALEYQFKLNPIRLSMDKTSFPVATKDIDKSTAAAVAAPTVEIGIARDDHPGTDPVFIFLHLNDLGGELVPNGAGIAHIGGLTAIGSQITAAYAAYQHFQESFSFARLGDLTL